MFAGSGAGPAAPAGPPPPCQITRLIPPLTEGLLEMAKFAKFLDKMAPVGASPLPLKNLGTLNVLKEQA